jgi:hypothetical protein
MSLAIARLARQYRFRAAGDGNPINSWSRGGSCHVDQAFEIRRQVSIWVWDRRRANHYHSGLDDAFVTRKARVKSRCAAAKLRRPRIRALPGAPRRWGGSIAIPGNSNESGCRDWFAVLK